MEIDVTPNKLSNSLQLAGVTQADQKTFDALTSYKQTSKELLKFAKDMRDGVNSDRVSFDQVDIRRLTEPEKRIWSEYTDATCKEAEASSIRHDKVKLYGLLTLLFLIACILICCCCCGTSYYKYKTKKPRDNFFGHNNGEDRLIINHCW